jgi:phosphoglycerate dehydrogenase-like enzyme
MPTDTAARTATEAAPRIVYIGAPEADSAAFEARIRADLPGISLFATNDRAAAMARVAGAEVLIGHHFQFDEQLLERAPRLRWIQSLTTGTDAILKLRALRPEVLVTSTRGMHGPQMSELVFLHMLALSRDFPRMQRNQAAGTWERWPQPLLWGKTVTLVGVGAISEALAPRCKAFGMTVYGVSGSPRVPASFDGIFHRRELAKAAALADFLVLIVPLSPETENLVDATVIAAMRPEAFLVNVARGGVLDEQALLAALRDKRIAGAALDVFRQQPLPADNPLWREPGVIVTPLVGGMSNIYLEQAYPVVRDNLRQFLAGRPDAMANLVAH